MRSLTLTLGLTVALVLIVSASVLAASPHAPAATCVWDNSSGNWSDAAHWSCAAVPGENDTATINGGTVNITGSVTVQTLILSGGTLQGSENITVTQAMAWSGCGVLGGSGATTIGSSAMLTVTWGGGSWACPQMNGRTLNILGAAVLTASDGHYVYLQGGSVISNAGTLDLQDSAQIYANDGASGVHNTGLLRKVGGTGTGTLDGVALNNTGTVQVLTGTLNLIGGGTSSGNFNAAAGATLNFGGGTHAITLTPASSINGAGTLGVSNGTVTIGGSGTYAAGITSITGGTLNLNLDGTTGRFNFSGGTLAGSKMLTVTQAMAWSGCGMLGGSGVTTIGSSAMLTVTWGGGSWACPQMNGRTLNNRGTAVVTASDGHYVYLQGGAVINNAGTLDLQDNTMLFGNNGGGAVNNTGLLRKVGGAGTATLDGVALNNTGAVQALTGTLSLSGLTQNGGVTLLNGGTLAGSSSPLNFYGGMLQGAGIVNGNVANIGGVVAPGNSPGMLRIAGNYTQGPTGTLDIELGGVVSGTQYDLLDVTGAASLSGTLNVSLIDSFTPISGTVFRILNFNTRSGDFITTTGTNLGWLTLHPYYGSDHLSLIAGTTMADLGISVTDDKAYAIAGEPITYTLVVTNAGPDAANGAIVTDTLPETISSVTWTCVATGGSCSAPGGSGHLSTTVNLDPGGVITFTIGGRLSPGANGTLNNTAYIAHPTDPNPADNSATDSDIVLYIKVYLPMGTS